MGSGVTARCGDHTCRPSPSRGKASALNVAAIVGPTASEKSAIAEAVADWFDASILSVDSMQVFRGMDIGTAKPSKSIRDRLQHHMIDVADPSNEFSVSEFQAMGVKVLDEALAGHERVIIVGGSGLHFRSLVDPLTFAPTDPEIRAELESVCLEELQQELLSVDPQAPKILDIKNARRVIRAIEVWRITSRTPTERALSPEARAVAEYRPVREHVSLGLDAGEVAQERTTERFDRMLSLGLLDEVEALAPAMGRTARQAVGYKELLGVVAGTVDLGTARTEAIRATNALVKRQRTYFGRDPRINWIPWQDERSGLVEAAIGHIGEVAGWTS